MPTFCQYRSALFIFCNTRQIFEYYFQFVARLNAAARHRNVYFDSMGGDPYGEFRWNHFLSVHPQHIFLKPAWQFFDIVSLQIQYFFCLKKSKILILILLKTFKYIKAVSDTVFGIINAIYPDKNLIFIGAPFLEKFVFRHWGT